MSNKVPSSSRCLWKDPTAANDDESALATSTRCPESYDSILKEFSAEPPTPRSFATLCSNSLVVGQEFALTCLFLARHRVILWEEEIVTAATQLRYQERKQQEDWLQQQVNRSQILALLALIIIAIYTNSSSSPPQPQPRKAKVQQRTFDALLWAILLRLLASVLQTLTASFSGDTVERLTVAGMIIHWFTCDYSYANGIATIGVGIASTRQQQQQQSTSSSSSSSSNHPHPFVPTSSKRPTFQGGTVSLNAAFFSTTLLASRLTSNATVYIFVSSAIILFAFFPAARHAISQHPQKAMVHSLVSLLLSLSTCCLLKDAKECICFVVVLVTICGVGPLWKFWKQRYKRKISGPWDVVSVHEMKLE